MTEHRNALFARYALAFAVAGLLAIWPLPQTMALRNLFYACGLLCTLYLLWQLDWRSLKAGLLTHLPVLAFFGWLVLHYLVFSQDPAAQYRELTGFWLRCLLASVLGMGLGASMVAPGSGAQQRQYRHTAKRVLFVALFGTLLIYLLRYLYEVVVTGQLLHTDFFMTPFKGKPQLVIFLSILLTAIFAGFPHSLTSRSSRLIYAGGVLTIVGCLFALFTANTKNGFMVFALLLAAYLVQVLRGHMTYKKVLLVLLAAGLLLGVGYRHVQSNPAWSRLIPDIEVGLNIQGNTYWKNWVTEPEPKNALGEPVNQSTYLRTAWFRAAVDLIEENPQGYGLMSYSFSYLAKQKWPDFYSKENDHMVATHSGWTDLTLAFGLPALLLVQFSWWRSFHRARNFAGYWYRYIRWTVPTLTFAYLTVEVSYDIFFELLFLFLGLFAALTQTPQDSGTDSAASP